MKKVLSILLSLVFIVSINFGQKTNDEGGKTDSNNDNDKPKEDNACMNTIMQITGALFGAYQSDLLASSNKNPAVTSFEIMLHGGISNSNSETNIAAFPRLRLNYGALSGDFRYSYIQQGEDLDPINTLDIIADFNIIAGQAFKMSLGQGIMYSINEQENKTYHESFIGMDIGLLDRMILISPEFRLAYDYNISKPVNSELSLRGGYRLIDMSSFALYLNIAAGYQYLNPEVSNTQIYGGVDIFIQ